MLPFTWYATIGKEDFEVFPVLFHFFDDSLLEVGAKIVQELGSWGDGVLLEKLVVLDSNLFQYLFERFFLVRGLEPSISGLVDFGSWSDTIKRDEDHILWIYDFNHLLKVVEDPFIDLFKGEWFYFVSQETVAFSDALINEGIKVNIKLVEDWNLFVLVCQVESD